MTRRRPTTDPAAELDQLYNQVPQLDCRGLCQDTCRGPIPAEPAERQRAATQDATINPPDPGHRGDCPSLTPTGCCAIHSIRPLICRLWGTAQGMPCVYGCQPTPGPLDDRTAHRLLDRAAIVSRRAQRR